MVPLDGCMPHPHIEKKPTNFIHKQRTQKFWNSTYSRWNLIYIYDIHSWLVSTWQVTHPNSVAKKPGWLHVFWMSISKRSKMIQATSWSWCVPTNHCAAFGDPGPSERNGRGHHSPAEGRGRGEIGPKICMAQQVEISGNSIIYMTYTLEIHLEIYHFMII